MNLPLISAKCITYGRVDTLEESLHSFLQQTYPNKEMVIVNDYPEQKLIFDHPQVRIVNLEETFSKIGSKENFATDLCKGEIICQWDDDDVALPNHMNNVAEHMTPDTNIIHWKTGVYCEDGKNIKEVGWIGNSGIAFRKSAWSAIGGHPLENAGYDMTFIKKMHNYGGKKFVEMPMEKASWFYMWGTRSYHMSGEGTDVPGKANVIQRHSLFIENLRKKGVIPTGDIALNPHWKKDYKQLLKDFLVHQPQRA
jgi:glycosyltransferase involved in cell wall biosynthesis